MRKYMPVILLVVLAAASCQTEQSRKVTPEPKTPVTEAQARIIITDFVNLFLADKTYEDDKGKVHAYPKLTPDSWRVVVLVDGRWVAKFDPSAGVYFTASVNEYGRDPKVHDYGFAPE